jgi:photosystem II stability/assembly factor-like uncharacterized protein
LPASRATNLEPAGQTGGALPHGPSRERPRRGASAPRTARLARAVLSLLVVLPLLPLAAGDARASRAPGPQCQRLGRNEGPCKFADALDLLVRPDGAGWTLVANFGVLVPTPAGDGWHFVCEENFGGVLTAGMRVDATGRLLVPSRDGVYTTTDHCSFPQATGSLAEANVPDLVLSPGAPGTVWAVTSDPRAVHVSVDGGLTFTRKATFPSELRFHRVLVSPSNPRRVYVAGYSPRLPMALAISDDGGDTFRVDASGGGFDDPSMSVDFLSVHPDDPDTLFIAALSRRGGDEIYRSENAGRSWTRVLALEGTQASAGLVFSPDRRTVYVAGREVIEDPGLPPAHLYISRDGGRTFRERIASGDEGPRYRCLAHIDGKLFACAGDRTNGDAFLLGSSTDEGRTWAPIVQLADVRGVRGCVSSVCAATAQWLCDAYGLCDGAPVPRDGGVTIPPPPGDGGPAPPREAGASADACPVPCPAAPDGGGGCGCRVGAGPTLRSTAAAGWPMMILMSFLVIRRSRRRR